MFISLFFYVKMDCCVLNTASLKDFETAIKNNHTVCLSKIFAIRKKLFKPNKKERRFSLLACKFGAIKSLIWLSKKEYPFHAGCCAAACAAQSMSCLKYSLECFVKLNSDCMQNAVRRGDGEILTFLIENNCPIDEAVGPIAVKKNLICVLQYLLDKGKNITNLWPHVIADDKLEILKYLLTKGLILTAEHFKFALFHNKKNIINFLISIECPVDDNCYNHAIFGNNLVAVKYIFEKTVSKPYNLCTLACSNGDLTILKFLYDNNFPWGPDTVKMAVDTNNFHCLFYMLNQSYGNWGDALNVISDLAL